MKTPSLPPRLLPHYSLVVGGVIRLNLVVGGVIRLNNNSIYLKPDDLVLLLAECTASATPHTCLLRGLWQNVCFPLGKWTFLWPHLRSSCGVVRSRDTMVYIWNRMISYYYWRNAAHPLLHSSVAFQAKPSSHAAAPTSDTLNRHTCAPPWTRLHPKPLLPFHHATHHPSHLNISATRTSTSTHTHGIQVASQLRTRSYPGKLLRIKRGNSPGDGHSPVSLPEAFGSNRRL